MLAYTLQKLLETQTAQILRDQAGPNKFGNKPSADFQPYGDPVPCFFYWRKESGRGPSRKIASPQRTIDTQDGGIIFPAGTDVTDKDRIGPIVDVANPEGDPIVEGPLQIQAVLRYGDHIEASVLGP